MISAAIVDVVLPDGSGLELVSRLLETELVRSVVCTSAFPPRHIPEFYIPERSRNGAFPCYFLPKPFTAQQLLQLLRTALSEA